MMKEVRPRETVSESTALSQPIPEGSSASALVEKSASFCLDAPSSLEGIAWPCTRRLQPQTHR